MTSKWYTTPLNLEVRFSTISIENFFVIRLKSITWYNIYHHSPNPTNLYQSRFLRIAGWTRPAVTKCNARREWILGDSDPANWSRTRTSARFQIIRHSNDKTQGNHSGQAWRDKSPGASERQGKISLGLSVELSKAPAVPKRRAMIRFEGPNVEDGWDYQFTNEQKCGV